MRPIARPEVLDVLIDRLLKRRAAPDHWDGRLANSALSTGTAVLALGIASRNGHPDADRIAPSVAAGASWLWNHQNPEGGWGDTVLSKSNISTTAIVWATLSAIATHDARAVRAVKSSDEWLKRAAGDTSPASLRAAILRRYGKDRTFFVPILPVPGLTEELRPGIQECWQSVPQLPF